MNAHKVMLAAMQKLYLVTVVTHCRLDVAGRWRRKGYTFLAVPMCGPLVAASVRFCGVCVILRVHSIPSYCDIRDG